MSTFAENDLMSLVNAKTLFMGETSIYIIVGGFQHIGREKSMMFSQTPSALHTFLPWNVTVAAVITWKHGKLSNFFNLPSNDCTSTNGKQTSL